MEQEAGTDRVVPFHPAQGLRFWQKEKFHFGF